MYKTVTTAYGIAVTVEGTPTPEELKVANATLMDAARTKPDSVYSWTFQKRKLRATPIRKR